ncbi:hypothetical protein A2W14_05770 [Candidatus Gottesmanbacteria bacterium RBG_16_37_8]|uniref:PPM-type phosphatase domain-containing protein n=1 Tax=Candidatus Gottesmanbacteria bacterium RBG_16_37_8 TaxID=1798371 RepID=A0A1F5YV19_9BACT|nr:MAG: hypothetical protein A2W14_05770 [Candidatus Gottesmanbacteria bacterium RBG_16_37_8]
MNYQYRSAKITSPSTEIYWGGCFVENELIVLLEIGCDGSIPASHLGKNVFDSLLALFKELPSKDKDAVKTLLKDISGFSFIKTALIGIISDSRIYLGCQGKGQAVLIRDEEVGAIVSGGFISQGQVEINDRIIFHSDHLAEILGTKTLDKIYHAQLLEDFEEELGGILSSSEKAKGLAVLELVITAKKTLPEINSINKLTGLSAQKYIISFLLEKYNQIKTFYTRKTGRQKFFLIALFILFVFFILNTFSGYIRSNNSQKLKQLNESLSQVNQQFEEAGALLELNPVRSRELLGSAKLTVSQLLSKTKKNSREYKLLAEWFEKISSSEIGAYKIYKLTAVPVFFDISLIKPEGRADLISTYQDKNVILDRQNKTLYFLDTSTKQSAVLAGSDVVKNAQTVAIHGNNAYVLSDDGIFTIDIEKKTAEKVIEHDSSWGDIASFQAFAANLYLLDRKNNTIWKYLSTETGFSDRRSYLNAGIGVSLAAMTQMNIDGSIYVTGGNEIIKFTQGAKDQFSLKGLADTVSKIDSFSTSENDKNIYILDKTLKRIVVFDKEGLYHSQYQWEDLGQAQSIVASESAGFIFVLIGNKIYSIDIK